MRASNNVICCSNVSLGRLERTARKAERDGNYACVIGAVAQIAELIAILRSRELNSLLAPKPSIDIHRNDQPRKSNFEIHP